MSQNIILPVIVVCMPTVLAVAEGGDRSMSNEAMSARNESSFAVAIRFALSVINEQ